MPGDAHEARPRPEAGQPRPAIGTRERAARSSCSPARLEVIQERDERTADTEPLRPPAHPPRIVLKVRDEVPIERFIERVDVAAVTQRIAAAAIHPALVQAQNDTVVDP